MGEVQQEFKGDWMLPGGEKLWAVQLEAGVWGGARLKDPRGQYRSRERRASSTSWCPAENEDRDDRRQNWARRSCVHGLPLSCVHG